MKKLLSIISIIMLFTIFSACTSGVPNQSSKSNATNTEEQLFMINGKLYYGTDEVGPMGDASAVEGKIASSVDSTEIPLQNAESNFGCIGNPYTYDFDDGMIMILMDDDEYHIFYEKH